MSESNPIIRFRANPNSRKMAINAMCAHCMGCTDEWTEPGFRPSIRDCTAVACPLWSFRPFQRGTDDDEVFPPDGWQVHPQSSIHYWKGTNVKTEDELRAMMKAGTA